jgi:hypothetical protein
LNKRLPWPKSKEDLTPEECAFIKEVKCGKDNKGLCCTWRALSEIFCNKFYPKAKGFPDCAGNQIHGMELCKYAAEYFGENYN